MKQLRGFLGLTGFFRKFIRNYSATASPLYEAKNNDEVKGKHLKDAYLNQALSDNPLIQGLFDEFLQNLETLELNELE